MSFSRQIVNAYRKLIGRTPLADPAPEPAEPPVLVPPTPTTPPSALVPPTTTGPRIPIKTPSRPGIQPPQSNYELPQVVVDPRFVDYQVRTENDFASGTDVGRRYRTALEQLQAFKEANPSPGTYSGNYANPALKAQYDRIYGEYQGATQPYFQGLEAARKLDPFVPIQRPNAPRLGSNQDALVQLNRTLL